MSKRIYQVNWKKEALNQLYQLNIGELAIDLIKNDVDNILSKNPYGKLRYIECDIKCLRREWEGFWRYRFGCYRIIYKVIEDEVLIEVFKVGNRENVYLERDSLNNY